MNSETEWDEDGDVRARLREVARGDALRAFGRAAEAAAEAMRAFVAEAWVPPKEPRG